MNMFSQSPSYRILNGEQKITYAETSKPTASSEPNEHIRRTSPIKLRYIDRSETAMGSPARISGRMDSPSRVSRNPTEDRNNPFIGTPSRIETNSRPMIHRSVDRRSSIFRPDHPSSYDNPSPTRLDFSMPVSSNTTGNYPRTSVSPLKNNSLELATEIINNMRSLPANKQGTLHTASHDLEQASRSVSLAGHYNEPSLRSVSTASHYSEPTTRLGSVPSHYNDKLLDNNDFHIKKRRLFSDQHAAANGKTTPWGTPSGFNNETRSNGIRMDADGSENDVMNLITRMYCEMREANERTYKMSMDMKYQVEEQGVLIKRLIQENNQLREEIKRLR